MRQYTENFRRKFKQLTDDPRNRRSWQGTIGIGIVTLFVLSSLVVNQSVQALNQSAGQYGYYGGSYGYGGSSDSSRETSDQVPSTPGTQAVSVGSQQAVISWAEVTTTRTAGTNYDNHSTYRVVYGTSSSAVLLAYASNDGSATLPSGTSVWTSTNDSALATRGTIRTTITGLTNDTAYYFATYACDSNVNCSDAPSAAVSGTPAAASSSGTSGGGGSGAAAAGSGSAGGVVGTPTTTFPSGLSSGSSSSQSAASAAVVTQVQQSVAQLGVTLSTSALNVASNFVASGTTMATIKLGSGERLALVRDQLETLGRVSVVALEQLANGQKPTDRNLTKEVAQLPIVLKAFEQLTGHRPNFKNAKDDLAWNTMMYRVRFSRDLVKEKTGIAKFKEVFKRTPKSPLDWAVVRAHGYALK